MKYSDDKLTSFIFSRMPICLLIMPILYLVMYMDSNEPAGDSALFIMFLVIEILFLFISGLIYVKFIKCFEIDKSQCYLILRRYFAKSELFVKFSDIARITLSYYMIVYLKNGQTLLFKSAELPGIKESLLDIKREVNVEIKSMYD